VSCLWAFLLVNYKMEPVAWVIHVTWCGILCNIRVILWPHAVPCIFMLNILNATLCLTFFLLDFCLWHFVHYEFQTGELVKVATVACFKDNMWSHQFAVENQFNPVRMRASFRGQFSYFLSGPRATAASVMSSYFNISSLATWNDHTQTM
jgi:hypothetical protein